MNDNTQDQLFKDAREQSERAMDKADRHLKEVMEAADRMDEASMKNFAAWRDYLHKYYSAILIIIGATGIFESQSFCDYKPWLYLALLGVFIGYLTINLYFYLERKWIQAQDLVMRAPYNNHTHPKAKTEDIREAIKLHGVDYIATLKVQLDNTKDCKQKRYLRKSIRRNRQFNFIIGFVGEQFGVIEKIWISGVLVSLLMTMIGILMVFVRL